MVKVIVKSIVRNHNKILALKRSPGSKNARKWDLPGGKVDEGELIEETMRREMKEETALTVKKATFLGVESYRKKSGKVTVAIFYFVEKWTGQIKNNPPEHTEWRWMSTREFTAKNSVESLRAGVRAFQRFSRRKP